MEEIDVTPGIGPGAYNVWSRFSNDVVGMSAQGLLELGTWITENREKLETEANGEEAEPNEIITIQTITSILDKLPERYNPISIDHDRDGYMLHVNHGMIFKGKPAHEAIRRTQAYVNEHEKAGWRLPTGVVNGIYD